MSANHGGVKISADCLHPDWSVLLSCDLLVIIVWICLFVQKKSPAYVAGSLQKNSLYTVLSFTYNITIGGQTVSFTAKFLYEDLTDTLPTEVTVTCTGNCSLIGPWVSHCTFSLRSSFKENR